MSCRPSALLMPAMIALFIVSIKLVAHCMFASACAITCWQDPASSAIVVSRLVRVAPSATVDITMVVASGAEAGRLCRPLANPPEQGAVSSSLHSHAAH
eukprot:8651012-Pyramimonas_sp.AAC.1